MDVQYVKYVLVAALAHVGLATGGHYQAVLKVADSNSAGPQWALTDDDKPIQQLDSWPEWLPSAITMLWMCRADNVSLPTAPLNFAGAVSGSTLGDILNLVA